MSFSSEEFWRIYKKRQEEKKKKSEETAPEDIAPVKEGLDFFQKGAFDDGFDLVDLISAPLATVADLGVGIGKGAAKVVGGIADAGMYGVAGLADLVGADSFANDVRVKAQENTIDNALKGVDDYLNQYSLLGRTSDAVSEGLGQVATMILTGAATGGLGTVASGAIAAGTMGVSSIGSGISEAYQSGATDEEAATYGLISGVVNAGSELIFGGLGKTVKALGVSKGLSSLDDVFAKKLSSKIANQTAKNFVEYGVKASAEGVEEVLAGLGEAVGKKLTYMSEAELSKLVKDENLLEQFVVGAVTSGLSQSGVVPGMKSGSLVEANQTGRDFVTGLNENEQKVVDKVHKDLIAEQEKDGKTLTRKEKNDLYDKVLESVERGEVSLDTIAEVLDNESYKAYKDAVAEEEKAASGLAELYKGEELEKELANFMENAESRKMKDAMDEKVFGLVKGGKLAESYLERGRRGESYQADLSKYDEKQKATVQNAINSGILNNTRKTHDFVDLIARITADKGVSFDFTNNEKLKNSAFAVGDGKTVNGFVTENGVTLNIDSAKSLNSVVGHEITHVLEGTELYNELKTALEAYATSRKAKNGDFKNEYLERYHDLRELYKDVDGYKGLKGEEKIKNEVIADLVGDYLFTDADFVNSLTANKNLFQKIYDEIKYLCKIATAGSKEARELEKIKRVFEQAYGQKNTVQTDGVKYSISNSFTPTEIHTIQNIGRKSVNSFNSNDIAATEKFARRYYEEMGAKSPFYRAWFGDWRSKDTAPVTVATKLGDTRTDHVNKDTGWTIRNSSKVHNEANRHQSIKNREAVPYLPYIDEIIENAVLLDTEGVGDRKSDNSLLMHYLYAVADTGNGPEVLKLTVEEMYNPGKKDTDKRSYTLQNIEKAFVARGGVQGNSLSPRSNATNAVNTVADLFAHVKKMDGNFSPAESSKIVNADGTPKVMYHGSQAQFTVFDKKKAKSSGHYGRGFYFSDSDAHAGTYGNTYSVYLNIRNPLQDGGATVSRDQVRSFLEAVADNEDYSIENYGTYDIDAVLDNIMGQENSIDAFRVIQDVSLTAVGDMVEAAELFNSVNGTKFDGIVVPTETVAFYPEQIKSATDNIGTFDKNNPDIRYSLSSADDQNAPIGNYNVSGKDIALDGDIAPVAQTETDKRTDTVMSADEKESQANQPIRTAQERLNAQIKAVQTELDNDRKSREVSYNDFNEEIAGLRQEYEGKKNKNTKAANEILLRIERRTRMRDSVDAGYEKRINDLEAKLEKMNSKEYKVAQQRKVKQKEYADQMAELVGDTSTWQDKKMGLSYRINTLRRNLRDIVRDANGNRDIAKADAIYDEIQGKYNTNEAALNREATRIKDEYAKMKITTAEDAYIQMLGELRHNPDTTLTEDVVNEFYKKHKDSIDTAKVDKAIEMARKTYDELLERVNAVLREQGMKEIPYRKGYFPHFTEEKQGWLAKLLNWKVRNNEIPTDIAGLTEQFNPDRSWQSFNKQRKGDVTDYSFTKGLDAYVQGSLDWVYHIEDIQKRRALENHIRYIHSEQGVKDRIEAINNNDQLDADEAQDQIDLVYREAGNPLNNFVTDLRAGTNTLAGKKSSLDRGMEELTNRKVYSVMTNISNRVSANMVAGSVSSALTNFIPITQSWGVVSPISSLRAMGETIRSTFRDDGMVGKSDFLTNRLRKADNLYKGTWDKVSEKVGALMEAIDSFTSQTVWRSKYMENMANGMSESAAIKDADRFAENVLAGRSRGNMPTIFDSKNPAVKMLTAFQLEVANQYGYMFKDMPQDVKNESKANLVKGYATMFVGAYIYNALYSSITGRDAAFDPIGIIEELLRDIGWLGDDEEEEPVDAVMNLAENILQEVPFVGGLLGGGRVPISSALPYDGNITDMIEGASRLVVEGDTSDLTSEWLKPLYYVALPMGGGQIKKTVQGLAMFDDDLPISGSYTQSGKLRFPVEDTFLNRAKAAVFGQYSSKNARDYFDNGYAPLGDKQIQEFVDVDIPIRDYWEYRDGLKDQSTVAEKFDYIAGLDLPIDKKNILINNAVDRKEDVDMTNYDDFADYEEFDWATKNPEQYMVSKAVTQDVSKFMEYTDALNEIKSDKDKSGATISGSRKKKVVAWLNEQDMEYGAKLILYKMEYPSDTQYNRTIIEYLKSKNELSQVEKLAILMKLGFSVDSNGNIRW